MYENLQNINTMEGVDAILQEYGSLADKTPKSTPIVWGYISQKLRIMAWYDDWYNYIKARNSSLYHDTDYTHT